MTLAALMLVVAVMSIMLAMAAQQWSFIQRREMEKELIHRGTHVELALYWWQSGGQPLPVKLEDMTKGPKRTISRIPCDPMTARFDRDGKLQEGTGAWVLIHELELDPVPGAADTGHGAGGDHGAPGDDDTEPGGARAPGTPGGTTGETTGAGGIRGIRSRSEVESIGTFQDVPPASPYSQWRFALPPRVSAVPISSVTLPEPDYPPGFAGLRKPVPHSAPVPHGAARRTVGR